MSIRFLRGNYYSRSLIAWLALLRGISIFSTIKPFINKKERILDFGAGICKFAEILSNKKYNITPLDVKNLSFSDKIQPILYNGKKIPYFDNYFDVVLIFFVLHHSRNHTKILREAKRVGKKVIIYEDIYNNIFSKYLTFFIDSLLNLEFREHPHSNRSDVDWQRLFIKLGFKLTKVKYTRTFYLKQAIYCLEK